MTNDLQSQADSVASGLLEKIAAIKDSFAPDDIDAKCLAKSIWYLADAYAKIKSDNDAPSNTNAIGFQEVGSDEHDDE